MGQVFTDGLRSEGDSGGPFANKVFDVSEAVISREGEITDNLRLVDVAFSEGFTAGRPYGGHPGKAGPGVPLVGEVEPLARADGVLDLLAVFECEERRIPDEECGVGLTEHGNGVGRRGQEGWVGTEEVTEE